jgi:hypothetical protein
VQKRETERQQQARLNSYAYISQKEEEEPWKELKVYGDGSTPADKVGIAGLMPCYVPQQYAMHVCLVSFLGQA